MTLLLKYPDTATFVKVESTGYAGKKQVVEQAEVPVIFVQNTGFQHSSNQDAVLSDAVCWPDFTNEFIVDNFNRLEGMYLMIDLYGADEAIAWYKVESVTTNRDHLLNNTQDNIELSLKKTQPVPGVS